ncbi:MAG: hypothetical protein QF477_03780, partial [SAR202 cluster bacterium]|nr:hypothetical protein [SAR202 cluster bacterium]
MAAERRTSMAALIREAVENKVATHRPRPKSSGMGPQGTPTPQGDRRLNYRFREAGADPAICQSQRSPRPAARASSFRRR